MLEFRSVRISPPPKRRSLDGAAPDHDILRHRNDGFNQVSGERQRGRQPCPIVHLGPADTTSAFTIRSPWTPATRVQLLLVERSHHTNDQSGHHRDRVRHADLYGACDQSVCMHRFGHHHAYISRFPPVRGPKSRSGMRACGSIRIRTRDNSGSLSTNSLKTLDISVEAITGQRVYSGTMETSPAGKTEKNIDLSVLPKGIYIVRLTGTRYNR